MPRSQPAQAVTVASAKRKSNEGLLKQTQQRQQRDE